MNGALSIVVSSLAATIACGRSETGSTPGSASRQRGSDAGGIPNAHPDRVPKVRVDLLAADATIDIDGKLDEKSWKRATPLILGDPSTGQQNERLPANGSVRLLWGASGFFVGFEVKDANVTGGFEPTDEDPHLWTKDTVEIMVDPDGDGDGRDYYEIQINPQNFVFDSQFDDYNAPVEAPNGPFGHESWSSGVKSAVAIRGSLDNTGDRDEGYVVEALLPWVAFTKAKRSPPIPGDTWRLNFYAIEANHGASWSPILGAGNFHRASRFGRVLWTDSTRSSPEPDAPR